MVACPPTFVEGHDPIVACPPTFVEGHDPIVGYTPTFVEGHDSMVGCPPTFVEGHDHEFENYQKKVKMADNLGPMAWLFLQENVLPQWQQKIALRAENTP